MPVPKLKCTTETVIKVQYYDLDKFIQEITGQGYECIAAEEWSNDSYHRFKIDDKPLGQYDQKCWDEFKLGGRQSYMLQTILEALCVEKHIPPGTYLIVSSW
jgi:hypothetical protein